MPLAVQSSPCVPPTDRLVSGEELLQHPEWGPCELIRGKLVPVCRPNKVHGVLMSEISWELLTYTKQYGTGLVVSGDSGVYLERDPDTVRGPDVYFIRRERLGETPLQPTFLEVPPDLCVEIVSPSDRWSDIEEKVRQYLAIQVKFVWVIDPAWQRARVYRLDGTTDIVPNTGSLSGEAVLPGFELSLSRLFSAVNPNEHT
jgi:Uma2 family endonuclease